MFSMMTRPDHASIHAATRSGAPAWGEAPRDSLARTGAARTAPATKEGFARHLRAKPTRRLWCLLAALALAWPVAGVAEAQQRGAGAGGGGSGNGAPAGSAAPPTPSTTASSAEPLTEEQLKAQQHFQRAKELYAAGTYREAVTELEAARALDPKAKDLVFNLGIVTEKLARYDEAITYFRQYMEMDGVTNAEKQKAELVIKRIEGAKREVPPAPTSSALRMTTAPPRTEPPSRGRVDALTIAASSVAVVGLGVGIGFGIRALSTRPSGFVTGRDGSLDDLRSRTDSAHTSAIISDVGFGVGILAALAATYLYFGRFKDPEPAQGATR
jgi:tetratricopeptide (TPR) repeat protein